VGRKTSEAITVLGDGLDDTVLRLDTAYDSAGRPSLFSSCDSATSCGTSDIVNQVQREYNGLGQLITEHQEHAGDVDTGSLKVQYAYSEMSNGNHSRPTSLTYPNGRAVNHVYGSGLDDDVSRVTSFTTSGATLEQYAYLGLGTVVKRTHPDGGDEIGLTYLTQGSEGNGEAGDVYRGLDRFGRVIDQRWIDSGSVSTPLDQFQYGHDRDSNRLYRENLVNDEFSELYHANGASEGYDNLNQLTAFSRGEFTSGKHTIGSPDREQEWNLDAMGNWESITTDSVEQEREHNRQNQVTDVESNELDFDDNGNTMTDDHGNNASWRGQSRGTWLDELLQLWHVVEDVHQTGTLSATPATRLAGPQASGWVPRGMSISRQVSLRDLGPRESLPGACDAVHLFREPDAGKPHVRFDERAVETEHGGLLGHRQPKGSANTQGSPTPPRHLSTLPTFGRTFVQFECLAPNLRRSPQLSILDGRVSLPAIVCADRIPRPASQSYTSSFMPKLSCGWRAPLLKHWPRSVQAAILQVMSLAHFALVTTRSWASNSCNQRVRLATRADQLEHQIRLLREESRIKDARLARIPPSQRPHYLPTERLAILQLRAARGWSLAQTARVFHLTTPTIASWMKRLDEEGPQALLQTQTPVNKFPDFVRVLVQRLHLLCPRLGKVRRPKSWPARACTGQQAPSVACVETHRRRHRTVLPKPSRRPDGSARDIRIMSGTSISPRCPLRPASGRRGRRWRCRNAGRFAGGYAAAMSIAHCVAHIDEPPQHLAQSQASLARVSAGTILIMKPADRILEAFASNKPHGIEWPAVLISPESINRHDAWVFKVSGYLSFDQKPTSAPLIRGILWHNLLERDFSMKFLIFGDEHLTQPAARVRPKNPVAKGWPGARRFASRREVKHRARGRDICETIRSQIGKAGQIVIPPRLLAGTSAVVGVQRHQFAKQSAPISVCDVGKIILEARPPSHPPRFLKAITDGIDALHLRKVHRFRRAGRCFIHRRVSFFHTQQQRHRHSSPDAAGVLAPTGPASGRRGRRWRLESVLLSSRR
jgi:hypothetical protein